MASLIRRSEVFYLQWSMGGKIKRRSLRTDSLQIAKEQLRKFESSQFHGEDDPFPTRSPIGKVIAA